MSRPSSPAPPPEPQSRAAGSEPLVDALGDYMARRQSAEIGSTDPGPEREPGHHRAPRRSGRATLRIAGTAAVLVLTLLLVLLIL